MAERLVIPSCNLHAIPDRIEDREAVFVEPLAAAFRIVEQLDLRPFTTIAILGDGKLGLLCAWVARSKGARVTLIGKHDDKLALAGEDIATMNLADCESAGHSFDVVVDCTGNPSGFSSALTLVRPCGTVVLKTTIAQDYTVNLAPIVIDEIRVIGSRCGPFRPAIEALARRTIDVKPLIGGEYPLEQAEEAFRAAGIRGSRKILIRVKG